VIRSLKVIVSAGVNTREIEHYAKRGSGTRGKSAFKGYRGILKHMYSINEEVVHGIPVCQETERRDILSVDIARSQDGFFGDAAFTFPVGR